MKKFFLLACGLTVLTMGSSAARAQTGVRQPEPTVMRDSVLESDMKGNLVKARHYFKLKKAYRASLSRAEEIIAGYPNFSQLDEALYIAGMSNLYMSEKKGKQPPTLPIEKHRAEARVYLSRLVNEYPQSKFHDDAEKELQSLGGVLPKTADKQ
ncbi:MAG: Outer rane lipoprotein [Acidobacteriota bacterium]|nr:Outer rane lipoprotein [Acidobacteriota bacterium]